MPLEQLLYSYIYYEFYNFIQPVSTLWHIQTVRNILSNILFPMRKRIQCTNNKMLPNWTSFFLFSFCLCIAEWFVFLRTIMSVICDGFGFENAQNIRRNWDSVSFKKLWRITMKHQKMKEIKTGIVMNKLNFLFYDLG